MSDDKKLEYTITRWLSNKERALSHKWYAIARIDLLIISISGGGIYVIFELMKYYKLDKENLTDITALKLAGIFFTLAVIVNFVSQFCGYYANENEAKFNNLKFLEAIQERKVDADEFDKTNKKCKKYNKWVDITNWASVISMILGIVLLVAHSYVNI